MHTGCVDVHMKPQDAPQPMKRTSEFRCQTSHRCGGQTNEGPDLTPWALASLDAGTRASWALGPRGESAPLPGPCPLPFESPTHGFEVRCSIQGVPPSGLPRGFDVATSLLFTSGPPSLGVLAVGGEMRWGGSRRTWTVPKLDPPAYAASRLVQPGRFSEPFGHSACGPAPVPCSQGRG